MRLLSLLSRIALGTAVVLPLAGCDFGVGDALDDFNDDLTCQLSIGFATARSMDGGEGYVYGAPFGPAPEVLARGTVEDLRFSVPTPIDAEDTLLEPTLSIEGDALAATKQSLSCATADVALVDGRIEARAVGTARVVVRAADGAGDEVTFEVREADSLGIVGPEEAVVGEDLFVATELLDEQGLPLYASSSVTWTVLEGDVTLPEGAVSGEVHGSLLALRIESARRVVLRADVLGLDATLEIDPR